MVAGRSLVEAQASLEEIFESTAEAEKMLARGEGEAARELRMLTFGLADSLGVGRRQASQTASRPRVDALGEAVLKEGKPVMVFVPIAYPEYLQVRTWAIAKYFDCGAPTTDAAERQWERQINRLRALGWQSPKSKKADAERMAAKSVPRKPQNMRASRMVNCLSKS
jgi:hypothetical protein